MPRKTHTDYNLLRISFGQCKDGLLRKLLFSASEIHETTYLIIETVTLLSVI